MITSLIFIEGFVRKVLFLRDLRRNKSLGANKIFLKIKKNYIREEVFLRSPLVILKSNTNIIRIEIFSDAMKK